MLDKTVPYKSIIMRLPAREAAAIQVPELSDGFSYRFWEPGDEKYWAMLETAVGEFESQEAALDYFRQCYKPYEEESRKRCVFVANPEGIPVATATSWYTDGPKGRRALLHWVCADPSYQGKGLGKAVVLKAVSQFQELEPGREIMLHTQTWSHVAIRLYQKLGFRMCRTDTFARWKNGEMKTYINEFEGAIEVLRTVLPKELVNQLVEEAV